MRIIDCVSLSRLEQKTTRFSLSLSALELSTLIYRLDDWRFRSAWNYRDCTILPPLLYDLDHTYWGSLLEWTLSAIIARARAQSYACLACQACVYDFGSRTGKHWSGLFSGLKTNWQAAQIDSNVSRVCLVWQKISIQTNRWGLTLIMNLINPSSRTSERILPQSIGFEYQNKTKILLEKYDANSVSRIYMN